MGNTTNPNHALGLRARNLFFTLLAAALALLCLLWLLSGAGGVPSAHAVITAAHASSAPALTEPAQAAPARAEPAKAEPAKAEPAQYGPAQTGPALVRTGAYITALYDFNPGRETFAADVWLWFLHDKNLALDPLKTLEMVNARDHRVILGTSETVGGERYHAQKLRAIFNHAWNFSNFPFDRHELKIRLEEGVAEAAKLRYVADSVNTGTDPTIKLDGWRVSKINIEAADRQYNSSFGLQGAPSSKYAAATVTVTIERDALGLFMKLMVAVYVAFMVCVLSFFLDPSKDGLFNGRVGMLIGMVFAVIVNSQRIATVLGQTPDFTLADKIHALTLGFIVFSLFGALLSRRLHMQGRGDTAMRLDRRIAGGMALVYIALNVWMVADAAMAAH